MEQFFQFVINHWALWAALVAVLVAIFLTEAGISLGGAKSLSPQEAVNLINHDNAVVIDIRKPEEFRKGHIIDSLNIQVADVTKRIEKYKNKPVIVVCGTGNDSSKIAANLKKQGLERVFFIKNGISGWSMVELPLSTAK